MKLRLATRGSALALAQSTWVARALESKVPGLSVDLVTVRTSGDTLPQEKWAIEGNKGLFVKEIEEALLSGSADLAVHSSKDLPAELPDGLFIAAYPEREDPRDILLLPDSSSRSPGGGREASLLDSLPQGARVGSASDRRRMQLLSRRPDLKVAPLRGNVDTRLRKLQDGEADALVLAAAGLKRLGAGEGFRIEPFDPAVMVPAPGQGALAVESRSDDKNVIAALRTLEHGPTRAAVECERAFMAAMGGGCNKPLGALAQLDGGEIRLSVYWAADANARGVRLGGTMPATHAAALAQELARRARDA